MSSLCHMTVVYSNVSHKLQNQRNDKEFCDVTLQVENETFNAHRCILSAISEYFLKMFTTDMKEKYSHEIPIKSVTAHAVKEILNSIYTGKIGLSEDNLGEILHAASMMQITDVLTAVTDYMRCRLSVSNCIYFKEFATLYSFDDLLKVIDRFLLQNIVEISNKDRFLELTLNDIEELLKSDDLNVVDEHKVFKILLKWVNKDLRQRQQHFPQLFKHIRLQFIPIKHVIEVIAKNKLVRNVPECRDFIEDTVSFYINPSSEAIPKPRKCFASKPDSLLCFSYQDQTVSSYNVTSKQYSNFCFNHATNILEDCAVASSNFSTFFCGGIDNIEYCGNDNIEQSGFFFRSSSRSGRNQVLKFDGLRWMTLPSLNVGRCGAAAVYDGSTLYVFGGETIPVSKGKTLFSDKKTNPSLSHFAKSFETLNESWKQTINDWQVRSYFSAQAINGKIYLIGGYQPQIKNDRSCFGECKLKVVCADTIIYSPEEDTWKIGGQLNVARASFGCASHQSSIYVVGGNSDNSEIASIEFKYRYDDTWTLCPTSLVKGGPKSVCFVRNRMYVASKSSVDELISLKLEEEDVKQVYDLELVSKDFAGDLVPFAEMVNCLQIHNNPSSYVLKETTYMLIEEN